MIMLWYRKHGDFTVPPTGISSILDIPIGGVQQSILIQAVNPNNPVLLFVHGGPSMPLPGVSCRSADYALAITTKELVKHFVVVFWDQRGTGKSYHKHIPRETMNLEQFVSDANEVTDYLRQRFHQQKIYLVAHSWGTTIALNLVSRYPDKFHAYVGLSQIVSWTENDRLAYRWVMERAKAENNKKAIRELTKLGEPPYLESFQQWGTLRKWLVMKYKSMFHDAGDPMSPTFMKAMKIMFKSPDYSVRDVFHTLVSGFKLSYSEQLIQDLTANNFFEDVPQIDVPIYFIHGRHETHVFPELTLSYYHQLIAPQEKNGSGWRNRPICTIRMMQRKSSEF
jgi:pimeloyl-ACP methyl ester carboxylesterase